MWKIVKRFYGFLLMKRFWAVVFFVIIIAQPIVSSILPYFYKLFVDAIPSLNYQRLFSILVAYIAVRIASLILDMLQYFTGDILTVDAVKNIRKTIFSRVQDLDFAFHTNKSSGSLISAFKRGDGAIWDFHQSIHYKIINVLVSFLVMLYFFKDLDTKIFLLAIVSFLTSLGITKIFVEKNVKTREILNDEEDKFTHVIVDNMTNFETVKLFAKEAWERERLDKRLKSWFTAVWKFIITFRYLDIGMGLTINASVFLMLLIALKLTVSQKFGAGDFVLVVGFVSSFYPKLWEIVWGVRSLAKNYTDIEKYFRLLDQDIKVKDPDSPARLDNIKGEIEFEGVTFSYEKKQKDAIRNINLKIRQGQSVALVGRSGAGKTTIVKLLLRFFDVDSGKITIDKTDIKTVKKSDLRALFGVVPQEPILFNNTIRYNIAYGKPSATREEINSAAKMANISKFIDSLSKKYEAKVGERGIKLSGGQKQRLAIARMILSDPEIIIFDEATSQLDSESERLIQDAFWKAARGKTTIIIAHRLSTIQKADKIIVMEDGGIKEEGSHKELLRDKDSLYSHFWNLQIKLD